MSSSSVALKSYGAEEFLSAENLVLADETVVEIFKMMFGLDIAPVELPGADLPGSEADERTALVGFSGAMRGSCQVRICAQAAKSIASAMLGGMPVEDDDDSISSRGFTSLNPTCSGSLCTAKISHLCRNKAPHQPLADPVDNYCRRSARPGTARRGPARANYERSCTDIGVGVGPPG